jgi:hypothetical protein
MMRTALTLIVTAASLLAATQASARMSDQSFIQASRCAALVAASELQGGPVDGAALEAKLRSERYNRPDFVTTMGDQARQRASREARHADDQAKQRLVAERDGVCRTYNQ